MRDEARVTFGQALEDMAWPANGRDGSRSIGKAVSSIRCLPHTKHVQHTQLTLQTANPTHCLKRFRSLHSLQQPHRQVHQPMLMHSPRIQPPRQRPQSWVRTLLLSMTLCISALGIVGQVEVVAAAGARQIGGDRDKEVGKTIDPDNDRNAVRYIKAPRRVRTSHRFSVIRDDQKHDEGIISGWEQSGQREVNGRKQSLKKHSFPNREERPESIERQRMKRSSDRHAANGGPHRRANANTVDAVDAVDTIDGDFSDANQHYGRHGRRITEQCGENEQPFVFSFQTDNYGEETSWFLKKDNGHYIGYGPPSANPLNPVNFLATADSNSAAANSRYGDLTIYTYHYCLIINHTYTLAIEDDFGDGMCCSRGYGGYEYSIGGVRIYSSDYRKTFLEYVEHTFLVGSDYSGYSYDPSSPTYAPTVYSTDSGDEDEDESLPPTSSNVPSSSPSDSPSGVSPTLSPTPLPTKPPTSPPTKYPTLSPSSSPTAQPTPQPTAKPTKSYSHYNPSNGCYGGDVLFKLEILVDKYPSDTSWDLVHPNGTVLINVLAGTYEQYEYNEYEMCLHHGLYNLTFHDVYGDGFCCRYGEGYYRVLLDGHEVVRGGSFGKSELLPLNVGYDPSGDMTQRDFDYLEAHNIRRKDWHERYNKTYVPLKYSPLLAEDARLWAEELLHSCGIVGIEHESWNPFGENLAKNTGRGGWGQLYPADNIVNRWVDFEIGWPYPSNGHLTQALWRASKYLGCGESVKPFRGGLCRVQVCRYGRAGNCDMARYNATVGENWLEPMLYDYTRCGPNCPQEGCF